MSRLEELAAEVVEQDRLFEAGEVDQAYWIGQQHRLLAMLGDESKPTQVKVAGMIGKSREWVRKVLALGANSNGQPDWGNKPQAERNVNTTKQTLQKPKEREKVFAGLTPQERAEVIDDASNDPAVWPHVKPTTRQHFDDEDARQARERFRLAKERQEQARPSTTVTEFFWKIIKGLDDVTRDLAFVSQELALLSDGQKPEVRQRLVRLRDQAQASIDLLDGKESGDDTLDGHAVDVVRGLAS
jgi:hypothetical protein